MAVNCARHRPSICIKQYSFWSVFSVKHRHFSDDSKKKDLYETLGLSRNATSMEIKKAYYDLTLKYHPDRNVNSEEAAIKFREASDAYEILGNYGLRKKYDRGLPVSTLKKTIECTVDHKAQYQEFFDSRSAKKSTDSDSRTKNLSQLGSYSQKKDPDLTEKPEESSLPMQALFSVFLVIVMLFVR